MARRHISAADNVVPDGEEFLVVDSLKTSFRTGKGRVKAVDGVSFTLAQGRTLGIVGESGSGKSVLSRSIMGLLPSRNVDREGSVRYKGTELLNAGPEALRALWGDELAMIFQDPMTSLNPVRKIGSQITESMRLHLGLNKSEANEQAVALMRSVNIPEPEKRLKQYPHELSGGMRQRVVIAIALACGPHLLFADEPTTALDVTVQANILELLQRQQRERFMSMILVTHDLGVVAGRAHEIAVMYAGQIVEMAPAAKLFANMRMPYTEALFQSIPKLENPSHTRLNTIPGKPPDLINPPEGCNFAPRCPRAQVRCLTDEPHLVEAESADHTYACWFPVGTPEGDEALAKNQHAGVSAAGTPVFIVPAPA